MVLIYVDDLGYGDLGCYGATKVQTPNIDRIAKEGRRFTDAHSASAVCTPSRYALLTGEYPLRAHGGNGVWGPLSIHSGLIIDINTLTIGRVFKNKGYATACLGKWHLGFKQGENDWQVPLRPGPQDVGFDYYFGVPVVNSAPPYVYVENETIVGYDSSDPLVHGGKPVAPTPRFPDEASVKSPNQFGGALKAHQIYDDEKTGTLLTEKAVQWISANKSQPFFLYFATANIHHPFTPAPRFKGTSQCGLYGDFIHELDWMVGEILQSLEDNGLSDQTLVLFTSDNGGMLNRGGRDAIQAGHRINGDLLGFKFGVWEGGHRVPFIARWPGKIKAGTQSDQLFCQVDLLATFMALTGQNVHGLKDKDSLNMLPALLNDPDEPLRTELLLAPRQPRNLAIRKGKWMYIGAQGSGGFTGFQASDHAWGGPAAVQFAGSVNSDIENGRIKKDAPPAQLYDLERDVAQTKNVYREHPEVVKEMEALLNAYRPKNQSTENGTASARKGRPRQERSGPPPSATPASSAASSHSEALRADAPKPNFVVIFADDLGYADLGCFGSPDIRTPRLDAMAAEGMRFTSFYAQPICGASRAALMTGCYPMRVAERGNTKQVHPILHREEITVAEILKTKGYATACLGKWDLANHSQTEFFIDLFPTRQGFDYFFGTPTSNDRLVNLYCNEELIEPQTSMASLTRRYTDEAIRFMREHPDQPFFVYLPHTMPHTRLDASPQFKGKSTRGLYGDVIEEIDFHVGRLLDAIHELGLAENTYVIFTSDNGPWLIKNKDFADGHLPGDHGGSAGSLRSGKVSTFEGGVRVPCIVWGPSRVPAGRTCDSIASTLDVLPTLAGLAGAEVPSDRVIDGEDIRHLFHGEFDKANPDKSFSYYLRVHLQAVRQGKWKLHLPRDSEPLGAAPFQRNQHIAPADRIGFDAPFLVDLDRDIGETTNVADQHPDVTRRLLELAEAMRADLGDYDRVGTNMRFFDLNGPRPTKPPVP